MINFNKKDAVAETIARILQQEEKKMPMNKPEIDETGFHMAAHAARKAKQSHFEFQGKKYPVTAKSHAEAVQEDDCVTKPEAKNIAKKEVKGHEKSMHHKEEIDVNDRTEDMIGGRVKTKRKDDVGPTADSKPTKVRFHAGPKNEEVETKLADTKPESGIVKTEKPVSRKEDDVKAKENRKKQGMKESFSLRTFKERYEEHSIVDQMISEVLSKDADAGDYIDDFVHSDNPKFAGKSKAKRKEMALAAYYAKKKNEEAVEEGVVDTLKKGMKAVGKALGGPDDEGHRKDLQRKMGVPQTGKPAMAKKNEEVEQVEEGKMDAMSLSHLWHAHAKHSYGADQGWGGGQGGHHSDHAATAIENHVRKHHGNKVADDMVTHSDHHVAHAEYVGGKEAKEVETSAAKLRAKHKIKGDLYGMHNEAVNEGWDDMVKAAQDKVKSGPKPSGGSGVKKGSRYGGGKQADKPEHDDEKPVKESKDPNMDGAVGAQPNFATNDGKAMTVAKNLAKKSMKRLKSEMLGKAPGNN